MKRPTETEVLGVRIKITWTSKRIGSKTEPLDGQYHDYEIKVSTAQPEQAQKQVLLHELQHAALNIIGLQVVGDDAEENEEQFVASTAPLLHKTLTDDRKLAKWIFSTRSS